MATPLVRGADALESVVEKFEAPREQAHRSYQHAFLAHLTLGSNACIGMSSGVPENSELPPPLSGRCRPFVTCPVKGLGQGHAVQSEAGYRSETRRYETGIRGRESGFHGERCEVRERSEAWISHWSEVWYLDV